MQEPTEDFRADYEADTGGLIVRVRPQYSPAHSSPEHSRWVWAYEIEIENRRPLSVQLVSRHWVITDATGKVEEVKGAGVVGEQPILRPGDRFRYMSGCPLTTPSGSMVGRYQMVEDGGASFEAAVPAFSLDLPDQRRTVN